MKTTAPVRSRLRSRILAVHRWLGIGAGSFWLIQAVTGVLIVFHWELRDAALAGAHRATDLDAIERRIDALTAAGSEAEVQSVWTTAGSADRYDISLAGGHGTVRVAGDGTILSVAGTDDGLLGTLVEIHHTLKAGELGDWIVAITGVLLLSNLIFGLIAARPRGLRWRAALVPVSKGPLTSRLYSWHRAAGLWLLIPAVALIGAGTLLKFERGVGELIGAEEVALPANPPRGEPVGFAAAAHAALAAVDGSTLTAVTFPGDDDATYRVRVRAPGEIRRAYGASVVLVDANNGEVRGTFPIADAPLRRAFMSALYPIHTGEIGGLIGRLFVMAFGIWLAAMVIAGVALWARRKPKRRRA